MRLLHVVDIAQPAVPRLALEFPAADCTEHLRNGAWQRLRRLLPLSQALDGPVHLEVAVGLVQDQIVRNASEFNADLVVLGVNRRGRLARLLHSTTGHALRHLQRPVLAVPIQRTPRVTRPPFIRLPPDELTCDCSRLARPPLLAPRRPANSSRRPRAEVESVTAQSTPFDTDRCIQRRDGEARSTPANNASAAPMSASVEGGKVTN